MTADVLREAAAAMRARAELVTPGPWVLDEDDTAVRARNGAGPTVVTTVPLGHAKRRSNAEHIASWHPVVAVAVANWLDAEAEAHTHVPGGDIVIYDMPGMDNSPAVLVARAYLGGTP